MEIVLVILLLLAIVFLVLWQKANGKLSNISESIKKAEGEREEALSGKEEEHDARIKLETELKMLREQMVDKEKILEESMKTAELVMLKKGREVFKEEATELEKKTREEFEKVIKSVASLSDDVEKSGAFMSTIWKSLSTPGAAGDFSELGLENTFKSYGLEQPRDFIMQYSVESKSGEQKRPDAVVFLPGNNLLVVDSKASKFFLEIAEARGTDKEEELVNKMTKRMNQHLRDLASKSYKDAVKDFHKSAGKEDKVGHIMTVMFVQNESNIEALCSADVDFRDKCAKENIILSGPTGLAGLMSITNYSINLEQKERNQDVIIDEIGSLLGSVEMILRHVSGVGKSIFNAAQHYEKLTGSINRNLLPKARRVVAMGAEIPKDKKLPGPLPSYRVEVDDSPLIEGESEELKEIQELELELAE